jgi:hypothetical protein
MFGRFVAADARLASMSRRRPTPARAASARWFWGASGVRLFDPSGVEYEPSRGGLCRADIDRLVKDREVPVAVHSCGGGVSWRPAAEAREAWTAVQADFEDVEEWQPPADAPGTQPYRAELWRASATADGHVLVFRND